jgi:hypothetical protein
MFSMTCLMNCEVFINHVWILLKIIQVVVCLFLAICFSKCLVHRILYFLWCLTIGYYTWSPTGTTLGLCSFFSGAGQYTRYYTWYLSCCCTLLLVHISGLACYLVLASILLILEHFLRSFLCLASTWADAACKSWGSAAPPQKIFPLQFG